jgi:hypothetical protein
MDGIFVEQRKLAEALTLSELEPAVSQLDGRGPSLDDEQPGTRLVRLN